jgi:hypothetical protein
MPNTNKGQEIDREKIFLIQLIELMRGKNRRKKNIITNKNQRKAPSLRGFGISVSELLVTFF